MQDKRFPPTAKRLRDARRRGDVAHSAEVSSALTFVVLLALLWGLSSVVLDALRGLWRQATDPRVLAQADVRLPEVLQHAVIVLASVVFVVAAVAALLAAAGSFAQIGALAAWSRLVPNAARLNPGSGIKRLFSMRNLIELAKMIVKTALLSALLLVVVRARLVDASRVGYLGADGQLATIGQAIMAMFAWAAVIYAVMAAVDLLHQRYEFLKRNRMSLEELKRERQDTEGSPLNQQRRRAAHHEAVFRSLGDRVARATLVVHSSAVAVALQYTAPGSRPRVIARGQAQTAEQIRRLARDQMLYVESNPTLAETLYREAALDQIVPAPLAAPMDQLLRRAQGLT